MTLERKEGILYPQEEAIRAWVTWGKDLGPSSQQFCLSPAVWPRAFLNLSGYSLLF